MEDYEQKDKTENNVSEPQAAYDTAMDATMEATPRVRLHTVEEFIDKLEKAVKKRL